jgi:manganese efflux pump family protein
MTETSSPVMGTWAARVSGLALALALALAGAVAGCSSQPAATGASVTSCYQFAARAIQRHVTVTAMPAACQGLSQVDVNVAVSRALRDAASGAHGKVRQRQIIARDSVYVAGLIRTVPASSPPVVAASPGQSTAAAPSGPATLTAPSSRSSGRTALSLAALIAWLVTVGLGVSMMARWITGIWRRGARPRSGRGPVLNLTHFGLAVSGLLVWISYLTTGVSSLAWVACGLVLAVASLGMALVFLTVTTSASTEDDAPPAGRPPVLVIAAHIIAAVVTILLVTLAAAGSR